MINLIAKNIVHFFVAQKVVSKEDEDVYLYGTEMIVSTTTSAVTTLVIALVFSNFYSWLIFFSIFIPLRANAGGYHANSYARCYLTTTIVFSLYILLLSIIPENMVNYLCIITLVIGNFAIWKYAPIMHINNKATPKDIKKRKIVSRFLICIYSLVMVALILFNVYYKLICAVILSVFTVCISMIIQIMIERRKFQ